MITVGIVEDDTALRQSLAELVNGESDMKCLVCCADGESALEQIPPLRPEVVLMDIRLPGMSGVECVRKLKMICPDSQVMMLTILEDYN